MTHINDWFNSGISPEQYTNDLDKHRESFLHIYNEFTIPEEEKVSLQQFNHIRAIVLAEVWCGHCMLDIPILLRLAEQTNMPVRFLPRDEHLELMDQYLTNGKRFIPIVIFIDQNGTEVAKWGPMAPEILAFVEKLKQDLPEKTDPSYDEAFQRYIKTIGDAFTSDKTFWQYVYDDLKKTLRNI